MHRPRWSSSPHKSRAEYRTSFGPTPLPKSRFDPEETSQVGRSRNENMKVTRRKRLNITRTARSSPLAHCREIGLGCFCGRTQQQFDKQSCSPNFNNELERDVLREASLRKGPQGTSTSGRLQHDMTPPCTVSPELLRKPFIRTLAEHEVEQSHVAGR